MRLISLFAIGRDSDSTANRQTIPVDKKCFGIVILMLVATIIQAFPAASVSAQEMLRIPTLPNSTPFAIAVADSFPYRDTQAVIIRHSDAEVLDVILLRKTAVNERVLGDAVRQLAQIRSATGDRSARGVVYRIRDLGREWPRPKESAVWVELLSAARRRPLNNLGNVPSVILLMPNQKR